jgi:hypothetical protein
VLLPEMLPEKRLFLERQMRSRAKGAIENLKTKSILAQRRKDAKENLEKQNPINAGLLLVHFHLDPASSRAYRVQAIVL